MEKAYIIISIITLVGSLAAFLIGAFKSTKNTLHELDDKYKKFSGRHSKSHGSSERHSTGSHSSGGVRHVGK